MKFKERCPDKYDEFYVDLQVMCAVAGVKGVLEIMRDMMQDYSDNAINAKNVFTSEVSYFKNAAAHLDAAKENIEELN